MRRVSLDKTQAEVDAPAGSTITPDGQAMDEMRKQAQEGERDRASAITTQALYNRIAAAFDDPRYRSLITRFYPSNSSANYEETLTSSKTDRSISDRNAISEVEITRSNNATGVSGFTVSGFSANPGQTTPLLKITVSVDNSSGEPKFKIFGSKNSGTPGPESAEISEEKCRTELNKLLNIFDQGNPGSKQSNDWVKR